MSIIGASGNDTLNGTSGDDNIYGYGGNDIINGNRGNDKIYGGAGNDSLYGGKGNDLIYGDAGNDYIEGDKGNDTIYGGAGNDTINGGHGHDVLTGGAGADTFIFSHYASADSDSITDFTHGVDHIEFLQSVFTGLKIGSLTADEFYAGSKAHDSSDRLIYDKKTGDLYYDPDGNGSAKQQLVATLTNHATLTFHDFVVA